MRKLSTVVASALIAATAAGAALPAQAQPYQNGHYDDRYNNNYDRYDRGNVRAISVQIQELERRIQRSDWRDRISEREAASLRRDVWRLRQDYRAYSRNGLSRRETQILENRIQNVRQRLRWERNDRDGRRW